jgi:signal peptidase I
MNLNFELILFYTTLVAGLIALFDIVFFARVRKRKAKAKLPIIIDYAYAFFPVLLIVFLLRSFLFEPFRIPSGSLEPTLLIGDFILVNKFDYGIRIPVIHKKIYDVHQPKRGDIMVFRFPPNPSVDFIKRVIGLPGDKISYIDKIIYVNGEKMPQEFGRNALAQDEESSGSNIVEKQENLLGIKHDIYQRSGRLSYDYRNIVVPQGMYFVMGDNRDDSWDSRFWGFVPEKNIVGRASLVWMSWSSSDYNVRWGRLGTIIN